MRSTCSAPHRTSARPASFHARDFHQHPADVGMDDDRIGLGVRIALGLLERPALPAVRGVGCRVLIGDLALGEALQADAEPRRVHHDEHRREALFRLADQPALRAVIVHDAGRVAVDAHLLLERAAGDGVALAERAVLVDEELGHHEQRDAFHIVRRAGDLGEDQVDDVLG